MTPVALFTWGYTAGAIIRPNSSGPSTSSRRAEDCSPVFVDIRTRRSVRAVGFKGPAFERLVGPSPHRWMNGLGNRFIVTQTGPPVQIVNPSAADDLLDLGRRVGPGQAAGDLLLLVPVAPVRGQDRLPPGDRGRPGAEGREQAERACPGRQVAPAASRER